MSEVETWYIIKQETGACSIVSSIQLAALPPSANDAEVRWGPYPSREDAIARRIGLIRAGKCRPT